MCSYRRTALRSTTLVADGYEPLVKPGGGVTVGRGHYIIYIVLQYIG